MKPRLLLAAATALVLVAAACGGAGPSPSASTGNKPTVLLQAPANGAVLAVGQNVPVMGAASDTVGVDHVALFADGVSFASTPSGQPAPLVPFALTWLATPAGTARPAGRCLSCRWHCQRPGRGQRRRGRGQLPRGLGAVLVRAAQQRRRWPDHAATHQEAQAVQDAAGCDGNACAIDDQRNPNANAHPTPTPTPTPTPLPTKDASGNAPDDTATEPHMIVLDPANAAGCPANSFGFPVAAVGLRVGAGLRAGRRHHGPARLCAGGQHVVPGPDDLVQRPIRRDRMVHAAQGSEHAPRLAAVTGSTTNTRRPPRPCPPSRLTWARPSAQTYNLYQFTVWQCQFANCANQ